MFEQPKYITDEQIKHLTPTNVCVTPVKIEVPKVLPKTDEKVTLL